MEMCCGGVDLAVRECALPISYLSERAVLYIHERRKYVIILCDTGYSYCADRQQEPNGQREITSIASLELQSDSVH
jgi:hypothetical protein